MPPKKPATLDHLRSKKKPVERSVRLVTDLGLKDEHNGLVTNMEKAKLRSDAKPTDESLRAELEDLRTQVEKSEKQLLEESIKFRFRSLGYKRYDQLMTDHLMTDERIRELVDAGKISEEDSAQLTWDPETFPVALIVACMIEPEASEEELAEWLADGSFNTTEIQELFAAAMTCNVAASRVELGNS